MTQAYTPATQRPDESEYDPYYKKYVDLVPETDIVDSLNRQSVELRSLFTDVSNDRGTFAYEPGKWTIKEVLGHVADYDEVPWV